MKQKLGFGRLRTLFAYEQLSRASRVLVTLVGKEDTETK